MRLKQPMPWNHHTSNGNTTVQLHHQIDASNSSWDNLENRPHNDPTTVNITDNFSHTALGVNNSNESTDNYYNVDRTERNTLENFIDNPDEQVCNQEYRQSLTRNVNLVRYYSKVGTLEGDTVFSTTQEDIEVAFVDIQIQTPNDEEERMFEQSDTDETSESGNLRDVPRGIVNPNYPGFQHLAHTLQDYSKNIENFYHSENEMTDDDLDAEVIDLSYDAKDEEICEDELINTDLNSSNNNNRFDNDNLKEDYTGNFKNNRHVNDHKVDSIEVDVDVIRKNIRNETPSDDLPDLLKNVNTDEIIENNNTYVIESNDTLCLDTDIENNFAAINIIGDFNKEVEDEINNIFNYNINFQEELQELRKDIEDAFKKPIEDTINHISDVVNHVIKQMVIEQEESRCLRQVHDNTEQLFNEDYNISTQNETNNKKEMKLSRPTFLYIENNINSKTLDAFLSDGKDELQINESDYETGTISSVVQRSQTLQEFVEIAEVPAVLTKEVTKIFSPQNVLNEKSPVSIDDNSNEILCSSASSENVKDPESFQTIHGNNAALQIPAEILQKEEFTNEGKEKNIDTTTVHEDASRTKLWLLHRERRAGVATSNGARQRNKNQEKKSVQSREKHDDKWIGSFDVYNIETAMPKLDLDAIESHLKAAKEAERRKRNDREEIRRRLAMGTENLHDDLHGMGNSDRPGRKPSLHSRLQSGMNLQICFMNETVSDNESMSSDTEKSTCFSGNSIGRGAHLATSSYSFNHPYQTRPLSTSIFRNDNTSNNGAKTRPSSLTLKPTKSRSSQSLGHIPLRESDFYALQATLQTEARMALAQAKEMARIHMERERRCRAVSPVTEMLRKSLEKANSPLAPDRRRVSRQLLTDMNVAQLQVIVNELHTQIELLNEALVKMLMARDELHMGQDSMLVDIEDLTRYLGVKEQGNNTKGPGKSAVRRLAALVKK